MHRQLKQDIKDWKLGNIDDKKMLYSFINHRGLNQETEDFLNEVLEWK